MQISFISLLTPGINGSVKIDRSLTKLTSKSKYTPNIKDLATEIVDFRKKILYLSKKLKECKEINEKELHDLKSALSRILLETAEKLGARNPIGLQLRTQLFLTTSDKRSSNGYLESKGWAT